MQSYRKQEKPIDDRIMVTRSETPPETPVHADNPRHGQDTAADSPTASALRASLLAQDPDECRHQAERAGAQRDLIAIAPLTTLLQPPRGLRLRLRRRQWTQARLAAVHALEQIGAKDGLPPLARALLDPAPAVQIAAAHALTQAGPSATLAVTAVFHDPGDWPLSGMKRLVGLLGQLHTPQANACLVPLVLGSQPIAPKRWEFLYHASLRVPATLVVAVAIGYAIASGSVTVGLGMGLVLCMVTMVFWMVFSVLCVLPARAIHERYERNALAAQAAEALCCQSETLYLPALIEGALGYESAFGYKGTRPAHARRAVLHLLLLVNAEDTARFADATRRHLMEGLGRFGTDMDMALLRVLEWAGSGAVIPGVKRIANRGATPPLRAEAARILPALEERHRNAQAPSTLLRPSQADTTRTEQLLRPGYATDTTPAIQLLRPGQAEE